MNRKIIYAIIPLTLMGLSGCHHSKHKHKHKKDGSQMPSFVIPSPVYGGIQTEIPRGILINNDMPPPYEVPNNAQPFHNHVLNERERRDGIIAEDLQMLEVLDHSLNVY